MECLRCDHQGPFCYESIRRIETMLTNGGVKEVRALLIEDSLSLADYDSLKFITHFDEHDRGSIRRQFDEHNVNRVAESPVFGTLVPPSRASLRRSSGRNPSIGATVGIRAPRRINFEQLIERAAVEAAIPMIGMNGDDEMFEECLERLDQIFRACFGTETNKERAELSVEDLKSLSVGRFPSSVSLIPGRMRTDGTATGPADELIPSDIDFPSDTASRAFAYIFEPEASDLEKEMTTRTEKSTVNFP